MNLNANDLLKGAMFLYSLYFVTMGVLPLLKGRKKIPHSEEKAHFAVLIAARNEEKVIGALLESLQMQEYDREKYDVFVLPNHCTDTTAEIAKNYGAEVMNCPESVTGKGDVLKFAFAQLQHRKEIDAYVVFDADNVADPHFLSAMNDAYQNGAEAAQGCRRGKNASDSWVSSSYEMFYSIQNTFFNSARTNVGLSASLNGTGWMVRKELIDAEGFPTETLTEDIEYTAICALNAHPIVFVRDAVTYDEYPTEIAASCRQRMRWTFGDLSCMKRYTGRLLYTSAWDSSLSCLDMALIYLSPLFQTVSLGMGTVPFLLLLSDGYSRSAFSFLLRTACTSSLVSIAIALFACLYMRTSLRKNWKGLLTFPLFMATWFPITLVCFFKRRCAWKPIAHQRALTLKEIRKDQKGYL